MDTFSGYFSGFQDIFRIHARFPAVIELQVFKKKKSKIEQSSYKTNTEFEQDSPQNPWVIKKKLTTCENMMLRSAKKGSFETEI